MSSDFSEMQEGFASLQASLAQMQGTSSPTAGNTLFAGQTVAVIGVYGRPRVTFTPIPNGGYRKKTETPLTITRPQLAAPPAFNTKLTRIDMTPEVVYVIDHVETQDPHHWILTLVNFAG